MFKLDNNNAYNEFDGIILTFVKGGECWPEETGTKTFYTLGDFNRFSVTPTRLDSGIKDSGEFLRSMKKMIKAREPGSEYDSRHHLFGLSAMPGSGEFWDNDTSFTFISLIQFGQEFRSFDDSLDRIKRFLETRKTETPTSTQFEYIIYYSMDVSDLFVFIKTDKMQTGRSCIMGLKKTFELDFYSFSHCGFQPDNLYTSGEIIDKLTICSTIDDPAMFAKWIAQWRRKYPNNTMLYERLGHEDFSLNLHKIGLSDVAYELKQGLLSPVEFSEDMVYGHRNAVLWPRIISDSEYQDAAVERRKKNVETLLDRYTKISEEKGIQRYMRPCMQNAIREMLKSVSMLEKSSFARDIVYCISATFETFIEKIELENTRIDEALGSDVKLSETNKLKLHSYLFDYIEANMSLIQGALQAEKMFFQVPGFNIALYDAQSKLVVFYTAFIRRLEEVLDGDKERFGVVLNIGLHPQLIVTELFSTKDPTDLGEGALLVMKIPMAFLFAPRFLMPQLIHEVAHESSDKYRCREERKKRIVYTLSDLFTDELFMQQETMSPGEREQLRIAYKFLFPTIDKYETICKYINEYFIEYFNNHLLDFGDDECELTIGNLKKHLNEALMVFFLPTHFERFIPNVCDKIQSICRPDPGETETFLHKLNIFVLYVYGQVKAIIKKAALRIDQVCTLMEESYSDLIMLKVSGITGVEYLRVFMTTINRFFGDAPGFVSILWPDFSLQRIYSVFSVYYGEDAGEYLSSYLMENPDDINMKSFQEKMKKALEGKEHLHQTLVTNTVAYLKTCNQKWDDSYPGKDNKGALENVREIFQKAVYSETISDFMGNMKNTYERFINDLRGGN